jgi:hypothetical protein
MIPILGMRDADPAPKGRGVCRLIACHADSVRLVVFRVETFYKRLWCRCLEIERTASK